MQTSPFVQQESCQQQIPRVLRSALGPQLRKLSCVVPLLCTTAPCFDNRFDFHPADDSGRRRQIHVVRTMQELAGSTRKRKALRRSSLCGAKFLMLQPSRGCVSFQSSWIVFFGTPDAREHWSFRRMKRGLTVRNMIHYRGSQKLGVAKSMTHTISSQLYGSICPDIFYE